MPEGPTVNEGYYIFDGTASGVSTDIVRPVVYVDTNGGLFLIYGTLFNNVWHYDIDGDILVNDGRASNGIVADVVSKLSGKYTLVTRTHIESESITKDEIAGKLTTDS